MTRLQKMARPLAELFTLAVSILALIRAVQLYAVRDIDPLVFYFTAGIAVVGTIVFGLLMLDRTGKHPITLFHRVH